MRLFTEKRRKRLKSQPFPQDWLAVLEKNVALYRRLNAVDRAELHGHIQVFVAEKNFEGGDGFAMTDEVRLTVTGQACVLLLHRETDYYPGLSSIVIYAGEFLAPYQEVDEIGVVTEGIDRRSGESWQEGTLVLSWEDIVAGEIEVHAGYNVVLHEFAHQLDAEAGITSAPHLSRRREPRLAQTLGQECLRLQRDAAHGRTTVLDPYGAESPAEFFAVATECFFEKPRQLKERHPKLYEELARFYRQDPDSWRNGT
jgi:Mlc titration factor MtfA (ptsG expression regulator)